MKPLIVYYSYSGTTKKLAEDISTVTNGDLMELIPQNPYLIDGKSSMKEIEKEVVDQFCPLLLNDFEDIDLPETIFIGSPNWIGTFAPPVLSFLREVDLKNKTIIPFCTHKGSGFANMIKDYNRECKDSIIKEGIALKSDYSFDKLKEWLDANL